MTNNKLGKIHAECITDKKGIILYMLKNSYNKGGKQTKPE